MTESQAQADADDLRLVQRLSQGDATAARGLYRRHGAALLRFALAMSRSPQSAEDVVHDTFVELLRDPRGFDPSRGSVISYLYGIARHRTSRLARQSLDTRQGAVGEEVLADVAGAALTDEQIDRERTADRVRRAVLELPQAQREVVALCDLQELPYEMVASILDCPIGTVRSRLHRARATLALRLDSQRTPHQAPRKETRAIQADPPGDPGARGAADAGADVRFACRGTST